MRKHSIYGSFVFGMTGNNVGILMLSYMYRYLFLHNFDNIIISTVNKLK